MTVTQATGLKASGLGEALLAFQAKDETRRTLNQDACAAGQDAGALLGDFDFHLLPFDLGAI